MLVNIIIDTNIKTNIDINKYFKKKLIFIY